MKNHSILINLEIGTVWLDICKNCLKKQNKKAIIETRPSPCACDYCGKKGE